MKRIRMLDRWRRVRSGGVWLCQRPGALWRSARRLLERPLKAERTRDGLLVAVPERNGGGLHLLPFPVGAGPWALEPWSLEVVELRGDSREPDRAQPETGEEGAAEAPSSMEESGLRAEVRAFLVRRLGRDAVPSLVIKAEAERVGYSWGTVRRVQKELGIEAVKGGMDGAWAWRLPKASMPAVEAAANPSFEVWLMPQRLRIGRYDRARDARRAVRAIEVALTASAFWKWARRFAVVGLAWLLVTSYLDVRGGSVPGLEGSLSRSPSGASEASPLAQTMPLPLGPEPFVAAPGAEATPGADATDIAARIREDAERARREAEKDSAPPKVSGVDDGLESFGLKSGGPGCDPRLAFKVPR